MAVRRILVIDDEGHIREVIRLSLELIGGWEAIIAASGHEGLVKASQVAESLGWSL